MSPPRLSFVLLSLLVACAGDESAPTCVDEACPEGMFCEADEGICHDEPILTATVGEIGSRNTLLVDGEGALVVATYDRTHAALVVGRGTSREAMDFIFVDGVEERAGDDAPRDAGSYAAATLDAAGTLHVIYYDATAGDTRHAILDGLRLVSVETIDATGDVGRYPTVTASGSTLHAAWHDETRGALRYGRLSGGTWEVVAVPGPTDAPCVAASCPTKSPDLGRFASIGLAGGAPVIAHYDGGRGDLLLSRLGLTGWTTARIDGLDPTTGADVADVGRFASLAVAPDGTVSIAYYDATNRALRYTFSESGAQKVLIVDDGLHEDPDSGVVRRNIVGQHARLTVSAAGVPSIWYLDATEMFIKHAVRGEGGAWSSVVAADQKRGGPWIAVSTLPDGRAAVAWEALDLGGGGASGVVRDLALWVEP